MIASIVTFAIKSALCSGILVGYYLLALKNARINGFNRIYLVTAALLSLLLPFANFQLFNISTNVVANFPLLTISAKGVDEAFTATPAANYFNWQLVLVIAYFAISVLMVATLALKIVSMYRLEMKSETTKKEGFSFIKTDDPRAPFSFMHMLFWPTHMRQDSPEGEGVMMHELVHIKQHHTLDKIFMQLVLAACWLNPFNWLIKKELWLQHEFLADRLAVQDGDGETFARMLLYSITNTANSAVISPFFQSPVKRRIHMLTRSAAPAYSLLRRLLTMPVLCATVFLLAAKTDSTNVVRAPKTITLVLDAAHGGNDAGAKNSNGQQEKDITLAICKKLVALSKEYNIDIITTRDNDDYPTLQQRVQKSNSTANAIFLSVHVNKSIPTDPRDNSYELGVNPKGGNRDKSQLLASAIGGKLKKQKLPVRVVDKGRIYVIRENNNPALLLECGNIDDADNMALLTDDARREQLCRNILSGIVDYNSRLTSK